MTGVLATFRSKAEPGGVEVEICIKDCVGIEAEASGGVDQGDGDVTPVVAGFAGAVGGTDVEVSVRERGLEEALAQAKAGVCAGDVERKRRGVDKGDPSHGRGQDFDFEAGGLGGTGIECPGSFGLEIEQGESAGRMVNGDL